RRGGGKARVGRYYIAGLYKGGVFRSFRHLLLAEFDELVDIALVVGEQDEALEMHRLGAGVVIEPGEREIDPLGREKRERARRSLHPDIGAVRNIVVDIGKIGHGEDGLKRRHIVGGDTRRRGLDNERQRHWPIAEADIDGALMIAEDQPYLLF